MSDLTFKKTQRGFQYIEFNTGYGPCTIQKSSNINDSIWFGHDDISVKHFIPFREPDAWQHIDLEELLGVTEDNDQSIVANNRMHLSRELVGQLLPILHHFVDTGELPTDQKEMK